MKKILIVEDNEAILKGLVYLLEQEGFDVKAATKISKAKIELKENKFDLSILDVMLPDGDGFELCQYIKKQGNIPVIFLTAKDEEKDVVQGLELGADDYIVKPFRNRELVSRINNILRRNTSSFNMLKCGNVEINTDSMKVNIKEKEVEFTALEYKILVLLYTNVNKVITREQILDKIWDIAGNFVNDNTLTVYVNRIRKKLGESDNIKTIKGIGYMVE